MYSLAVRYPYYWVNINYVSDIGRLSIHWRTYLYNYIVGVDLYVIVIAILCIIVVSFTVLIQINALHSSSTSLRLN